MSAFEKGQKNGSWQELNCLISIPTLNIYLKVKLKPLQKLKTGCVNTMLSIYNDPQGWASPTKALENCGNKSLSPEVSPSPLFQWGFREHTEPLRKDLGCRILKQWCLPCSWGGLCSTLCCSQHSSREVHPHSRMGYTCHIAGIKCAPAQESSAHHRSWHRAEIQEWCFHFGYAVGMFDCIMRDVLTTLEIQTSCKPSEQFRWSAAFLMPTPEEAALTKEVNHLQATDCKKKEWKSLHSADSPKVVYPHFAATSCKLRCGTDKLDPDPLIRKWP